MALHTGSKHWAEDLNWYPSRSTRDVKQGPKICGQEFPQIEAISSFRQFSVHTCADHYLIRWRVKGDPEIHEFEVKPDYEYDDPYTQVQALLVAIKLSC